MIETKRLLLEPLCVEHAERMFAGLADPQIYKYLPDNAPPSLSALQDHYRTLIAGAGPGSGETGFSIDGGNRSN